MVNLNISFPYIKLFLAVVMTGLLVQGCRTEDPGDRFDRIVPSAMESEGIPGAVLLVARGDEVIHHRAYGYPERYDFEGKELNPAPPMLPGYVFDLASLTKVYATTFALMLLVDSGKISLDDKITDHLPDYSIDKDEILIRHLLNHTSGLMQWQPLYLFADDPSGARAWIAGSIMESRPGEKRAYSDLGFLTLGYLVEEVSGQPLDQFLEKNLYQPLGLENTLFNPLQSGVENLVATSHGNPFEIRMIDEDDFGYEVDASSDEMDEWREYVLKGEVSDGNAWHAHRGVAGHAGLFSTAEDLLKLSRLILNEGMFEGRQIISPATLHAFMQKDDSGNALGWMKNPAILNSDNIPPGTIGHTGFTGTSAVIIPEHDAVVILLTNRQHGFRSGNYPNMSSLRGEVLEAALEMTR